MSQASTPAHGHGHADDGKVHAHISSFGFLVAIFMALIVLTVITVAASYVDFGSASIIIAVLIATIKASLVALFFMHLLHDKPFFGFIFVMAFVFLGVFLTITLDDVSTRGRVDDSAGVRVLPRSGAEAPGAPPGEFDQEGRQILTSPAVHHEGAPGSTEHAAAAPAAAEHH